MVVSLSAIGVSLASLDISSFVFLRLLLRRLVDLSNETFADSSAVPSFVGDRASPFVGLLGAVSVVGVFLAEGVVLFSSTVVVPLSAIGVSLASLDVALFNFFRLLLRRLVGLPNDTFGDPSAVSSSVGVGDASFADAPEAASFFGVWDSSFVGVPVGLGVFWFWLNAEENSVLSASFPGNWLAEESERLSLWAKIR